MKILAAIFWMGLFIGACTSCVTLTEEEQIQREYEIADRKFQRTEEMWLFIYACKDSGGILVVKKWLATRIGNGEITLDDKLSCSGGGF